MLDDYKLKGATQKLEVDVESETCEILKKMATHTKISVSELTNTALKRFIASHKDFLPKKDPAPRVK